MLAVLWTVVITAAAMVGWDTWTSRQARATGGVYDWERDQPLRRLFDHERESDQAWTRHFDQHGVLIFDRRESR
jgi:hypothetical protein